MANKTATIKDATDKEIDELLTRLRKENELQNLIGEIKRRASSVEYPYYAQNISTETPIENLYHFGIPGMHWGVRRKRGSDGTVGGGGANKGSEDFQSSRALKRKGSKNLSTKELKDLTQRLQLEKQLKDLNPSKYKKGVDFVKSITAAGTAVASLYALSKTPLGQDVVNAVKMAMSTAGKAKWVL